MHDSGRKHFRIQPEHSGFGVSVCRCCSCCVYFTSYANVCVCVLAIRIIRRVRLPTLSPHRTVHWACGVYWCGCCYFMPSAGARFLFLINQRTSTERIEFVAVAVSYEPVRTTQSVVSPIYVEPLSFSLSLSLASMYLNFLHVCSRLWVHDVRVRAHVRCSMNVKVFGLFIRRSTDRPTKQPTHRPTDLTLTYTFKQQNHPIFCSNSSNSHSHTNST